MRVSCLQENLIKGLTTVGRAVQARSSLPVLANVLLATDNGRLKLSATNLEIGINYWLDAMIEVEGAVTIPAKLLTEFVNALPAERIDLELNAQNQTLHIRCARHETNIKGIAADEFPIVPTAQDADNALQLEPTSLRQTIDQVVFAAATDESRPILTGVLVQIADNQLTMAAADGYRLSVKKAFLVAHGGIGTDQEVVIPAKALGELARISSDQTEPIAVILNEDRRQVLFHMSNVDLVSQLVEGKFPDYRQIIPDGHTTQTVVDTDSLLKAVRVSYLFARDSANIVKLELVPSNDLQGKIVLTATSSELGDHVSEVDATVNGDSLAVAFNAKYMIDVLAIIDTPQVVLETSVESSPGVLKPIGDEEFTHIIMPMHLNR